MVAPTSTPATRTASATTPTSARRVATRSVAWPPPRSSSSFRRREHRPEAPLRRLPRPLHLGRHPPLRPRHLVRREHPDRPDRPLARRALPPRLRLLQHRVRPDVRPALHAHDRGTL